MIYEVHNRQGLQKEKRYKNIVKLKTINLKKFYHSIKIAFKSTQKAHRKKTYTFKPYLPISFKVSFIAILEPSFNT